MKYLLLLSFMLFLLCAAHSQDSIELHTSFLPQHIYEETVSQKFNAILNYSGSDSTMNVLKEKGITTPQKNYREINMSATINTGSYNAKNIMPVQLEFIKAYDKTGNSIIPSGTKLIGTYEKNKTPVYDSVISESMDAETKKAFLHAFKNILSQISLPYKKMTKGDTAVVITPLNFPVGDITFKMIFTTTYKLTSLNDSLANFDIDIKYIVLMDSGTIDMSGSGNGSGTMIIDRKNNFPLRYTSNYSMDLKASKNKVLLHVNLDGSSNNENLIRIK